MKFLFLSLLGVLPMQAQETEFSGIITNQDGKPVADANVCIYRPNYDTGVRDFEYMGITNGEGRYSVKVEETNCTYNMSVEAEGYPIYVINTPFAVKNGVISASPDFTPKDISLWSRLDFIADQQATIFLPVAPDASWGRYYRFDRYEEWGVIFQREMNPQANVPYVIFPNHDFSIDVSDYDVISLIETTPYDAVEGWGFNGSYQSKDFLFGSMRAYIIDSTPDCWDGHIPYPARVGAFRAYLIAYHTMSVTYGEPRCIFIDEQTGIDDVTVTKTTSPIFDLQGRRLRSASPLGSSKNGKPEKGVYIQDGKKRIVRFARKGQEGER